MKTPFPPIGSALVVLATSTAIAAAEAPSTTATATGTIIAEPIGFDGRPLAKNSISLWRKVADVPATKKDLWHDPFDSIWWACLQSFATSGPSTFDKLEPGTYRVRVRDGHDQTGAFGLSDPVVLDADHRQVSTKISPIRGGTLRIACLDDESGQPIPPPRITLELTDDSMWQRYQFAAEPIPGQRNYFQFSHLPPGKYRLSAERWPRHPDDLKYELIGGPAEIEIVADQAATRDLRFSKSPPTPKEIARDWPFVVQGRVTDDKGQPVADAVVRAFSGLATLFQTGAALTDADGRYQLRFRAGAMIADDGFNLLPALVSVTKPGLVERNLNQQGELAIAYRRPPEMPEWFANRPLVLPNEPRELNFTLTPYGSLAVDIHAADGRELDGLHISLKGQSMPPGSSVIDSGSADRWGEITFDEVPLDHDWWIEVGAKDRRTIRTQPFRLTAPQRYNVELEWRTDATGIEVLDVVSLTDSFGRDQTRELVDGGLPIHIPLK